MDDGRLTGSTGKTVDFTNVVLIMTSNLGAAAAETLKIGFGDQKKTGEVSRAVEKFFTPEFRNRLDSVIQFNKLEKGLMLKIVERLIKETNTLLASNERRVRIELTDAAIKQLADEGYEPSMGARPLKRVFEERVKKPLSRKVLFDDVTEGTIIVDYDAEFKFTSQR
jgi:ATP-dependent Clp protease ATP-binding subunit ClpA